MVMDVQNKVTQLRNEVKAQKVFSGLTYSQLLLPENTPTLSYSDTVSLSGSGPVAKIRFRFTRTDGLVEPPFINFAYTGSISPTYRAFAESYGFSFSANDLSYMDRTNISGYIAGLGDGYIDFYVEFNEYLRDMFFSRNNLTISITCQAIANVAGNLSVERII
ncbi:MAG: hypothetical protein U0L97_01615 [Candidatus Saccharimonadaceae bacterium]|nr:hypothetical protein [Candidatus Saccharimonadaceae bacterium]